MSLSQLTRLIPPPETPVETGSSKRWHQVQERLGVNLPAEYQSFLNTYGTGQFSNGIIVYNPFARDDVHNLFQAIEIHHLASSHVNKISMTDWSIIDPFQLYPAQGGLLPWGMLIDLKVTFFWNLEEDHEIWPTVVYDLRRGEYEVWKFGFVDFLLNLLYGEINSVILPKSITHEIKLLRFRQFQGIQFTSVTKTA